MRTAAAGLMAVAVCVLAAAPTDAHRPGKAALTREAKGRGEDAARTDPLFMGVRRGRIIVTARRKAGRHTGCATARVPVFLTDGSRGFGFYETCWTRDTGAITTRATGAIG